MKFFNRVALALAKRLHLDLTHSQVHYARTLSAAVSRGDMWLDLGCGHQLLPSWVMDPARQRRLSSRAALLVGMDFDSSILRHPLLNARVVGRGEDLPFEDGTFDLITANMVVEHLEDPRQVLQEVQRVLKPGGRLIFHTPNYRYYLIRLAALTPDFLKRRLVWWLEGRREEDIFPTVYRMNTVTQVREFAKGSGLEIESIEVKGSAGEFYTLGPLYWIECFWLKFLSVVGKGRFAQALIVTLRRPAAVHTAETREAAVEGIPA